MCAERRSADHAVVAEAKLYSTVWLVRLGSELTPSAFSGRTAWVMAPGGLLLGAAICGGG